MIAIECGHSHSVAVSETSQMLVRIQAQLLCFLSMFSKSLLHSDSQRFTTTGNRGYHLTEINGCRCSSNPPAIFALLKIGMEAVNPLHPLWVSEAQGLDFRLPLEQRVLQLGYHGMQHSGLVVHSIPLSEPCWTCVGPSFRACSTLSLPILYPPRHSPPPGNGSSPSSLVSHMEYPYSTVLLPCSLGNFYFLESAHLTYSVVDGESDRQGVAGAGQPVVVIELDLP